MNEEHQAKIAKIVEVPDRQLPNVLESGAAFDGSSISGYAEIEESDIVAMPDWSTFTVLPWAQGSERTAFVFCDVLDRNYKPFEGDPRWVLRRQLERAQKLGLDFYVGPELEYFYFKSPEEPELIDDGGYFDVLPAVIEELGLLGALEVEVLELRTHVEVEAQLLGALELAAQHPARVALEGLVVAVEDVAEHERGTLAALRPGQHRERAPVGHRHDVRLLDLRVPADRGAVEGRPALEHVVQLAVGNLDHLQVAEDVREPQLDVLHVLAVSYTHLTLPTK